MTTTTTSPGFRLQGWHVLAMLLAFFGAIFAVNGVFLWQALATNTGLVANEPYRKGLRYNDRIAAEDAQKALGWTEGLELSPSGALTVTLADSAGKPVSGLIIDAAVGRPATNAYDVRTRLVEGAPGVYQANLSGIGGGTWQVDVAVENVPSLNGPYRSRRRLWIKS